MSLLQPTSAASDSVSSLRLLSSDAAREASQVLVSILGKSRQSVLSDRFFESDHRSVWNELASGGWLSLGTADTRGGLGFHAIDLVAVAEIWGRYLVPLPFIPTMLIWRWSDRNTGSFDQAMLTYALGASDDSKAALSPFLPLADVGCVTNLAASPGTLLSSRTLLGADNAGRGRKVADHAPSLPLGETAAATTGLPPHAKLDVALLGAAELIGCGSTVLDVTLDYARSRQQFGQPIVDYQAIQHRLANMHRDIEIARSAITWAANEPDRALGAVRIVWDKVRAMSENSFQIHGGYGFTWDSGIHFYSRHVWAMGRLLAASGVRLWPS